MPVWFGDRKIYVNTRETQTVKICDCENIRGQYEHHFRISRPHVREQRELESEILERSERNESLDDLRDWLIRELRAIDELDHPEHAGLEDSAFTEPVDVGRADDSWIANAAKEVESAIDQLLYEFCRFPLLHRVEHSLHTRLYQLLTDNPVIRGHHTLGRNVGVSQLVHKEWPETYPRPSKKNRRGNFDLAVLSPKLLAACQSRENFLEGRLATPIAIEIGVDYDAKHLLGDIEKLENSRVRHGYIVHLLRERSASTSERELLLERASDGRIRTAFASVESGTTTMKRLGDEDFHQCD